MNVQKVLFTAKKGEREVNYRNQSDETLVLMTLAGEKEAFEELVIRHRNTVIAAAASVTHNHFMAEDASQDAFVTAWMKLDTLAEPSKFLSWVCKIAIFCAKNTVRRYRPFAPIEDVEKYGFAEDYEQDPASLYAISEEKEELHRTVLSLPERVRRVITLHYFEELTVAEIAEQMNISVGTVKSQLHEGRKRLRKELCAMNEKANDTLVERVMKKVEEIKLWQIRNDKSGFDAVYSGILAEVEDLPESKNKYHALADVLARGWWWLPGKKNETLFSRIKEAALIGKNDEIMRFIILREGYKQSESRRADFIRNEQIPELERAGFVGALAFARLRLGYRYLMDKKYDESRESFLKARSLVCSDDVVHSLSSNALVFLDRMAERFWNTGKRDFSINVVANKLKIIDGKPRFWNSEEIDVGWLNSGANMDGMLFETAGACDGFFFSDLSVGESYTATDGSTLTYLSDSERAETPAGVFENCQVWESKVYKSWCGTIFFRTFYKEGVGIVKYERRLDGITDKAYLTSYEIKGGSGILPLAVGNKWEYSIDASPEYLKTLNRYEVTYTDGTNLIISGYNETERFGYDESSWLEMIEFVRNNYFRQDEKGDYHVCDIYRQIELSEKLAVTPLEKLHSRVAASVARRILDTNDTLHPDTKTTGHWNFFKKSALHEANGEFKLTYDSRFSFELKRIDSAAADGLLFNHMYGILQDATKTLWSDTWVVGATPVVEYDSYGDRHIRTVISVEDGGSVTTKAGTFDNCLKLSLKIDGMTEGLAYRGGNKDYYFAEGIGIVRTVNEIASGTKTAIYELSSYVGTGKGYMPFEDGLVRFYEAVNLTDGYYGAVEYTYFRNEDGGINIFENMTGIRNIPAPTTEYEFVEREIIEDRIWDEKKLPEARLRNSANNLQLMLHFLSRNGRSWKCAPRGVAWAKYRLKMIENMLTDENGEIAPAWLGIYADMHFMAACTTFGCKKPELKDEAYAYLERAFELAPKWFAIADGTLLDVGDSEVYGGIKLEKGSEGTLHLPDGTREFYDSTWFINLMSPARFYNAMTAKKGWEWFNSVREEERYKEFVKRAREMMEKYGD